MWRKKSNKNDTKTSEEPPVVKVYLKSGQVIRFQPTEPKGASKVYWRRILEDTDPQSLWILNNFIIRVSEIEAVRFLSNE